MYYMASFVPPPPVEKAFGSISPFSKSFQTDMKYLIKVVMATISGGDGRVSFYISES